MINPDITTNKMASGLFGYTKKIVTNLANIVNWVIDLLVSWIAVDFDRVDALAITTGC